eukprot:gene3008-5891_t
MFDKLNFKLSNTGGRSAIFSRELSARMLKAAQSSTMISTVENQEDDSIDRASSIVSIPDEMDNMSGSKDDESEDGDADDVESGQFQSNPTGYGNIIKSDNRTGAPTPILIPDSDGRDVFPQTPTPFAIPSLRGKLELSSDKSKYVCRGLWAMSDALHDVPGQTSDFEFKLVQSNLIDCKFPVSGRYNGWFILQQPNLKTPVKVEDKEINIRFHPIENGLYKIEGEGHNKFGKFTVYGTLSQEGVLQMYRAYVPKPLTSTTNKSKKSHSKKLLSPSASDQPAEPTSVKSKSTKPLTPSLNIPITQGPPSVREHSARGRKPISFGAGFEGGFSQRDEDHRESVPIPTVVPTPTGGQSKDGRSQRLTQHMLKCAEMLKDLIRQPQAIWFIEPVDYIKLNIPDYPTVIKEPMDFKTIRLNLEKNVYKSPEEFAEHVRLTFRNAITYNTLRDNPVHIAAREMSNRFEEKYRVMMSQFGTSILASDYDTTFRGGAAGAVTGGGSTGSKKNKKGNMPLKRTSSGPRALEQDTLVTGGGGMGSSSIGGMDGNMQAVMEDLNRKIREMQSEITQLRSAVKNAENRNGGGGGSSAYSQIKKNPALEPLTLEEKKALISRINKLAPDRMARVVDIIQSAMPPSDKDDNDEVEIPLDELDTKTLRKLQDYVQNIPTIQTMAPKRKRQSTGNTPKGSGSSSNGHKDSAKRAKGKEHQLQQQSIPVPQRGFGSIDNISQRNSNNINGKSDTYTYGNNHHHHGNGHEQHALDDEYVMGGTNEEDDDENTHEIIDNDNDDMLPDIFVPESGEDYGEESNSTTGMDLMNTSAWSASNVIGSKSTTPSKNGMNGHNDHDTSNNHSTTNNTTNNSMWKEAKLEKEIILQREADRKVEEERIMNLKAKMDSDRFQALQSSLAQQEIDKKQADLKYEEDQAIRLQIQRDEERQRRANLEQTVIIDQKHEMLTLMEDM